MQELNNKQNTFYMKLKFILPVLTLLAVSSMASAQDYEWESVEIKGEMTGCVSPSIVGVSIDEALGTIKGGKYYAPNGTVHKRGSAAYKTAKAVIDAQPEMERVRVIIGHSPKAMTVSYPESALSNWFVDILMKKVETLAGKKVDIGVANFGGIRVDMPEGDIILDDMLSMFPFKNQLVYVEHTGKQLKNILERMAAGRFQVLGGVRIIAEDGKILKAEIDGEPIDDDRIYGMATISFLLGSGDDLYLGDNAVSVTRYDDVDVIDAILEHVYAETAAGRPIKYEKDGRVTIIKM